MGISCLGLKGGPAFKHYETFLFQVMTNDQAETDCLWSAILSDLPYSSDGASYGNRDKNLQ